jgi:hypothetical protein
LAVSRSNGLVEAAAAGELLPPVGLIEAVDPDLRTGVRGVDELVAPERDPNVVDVAGRVTKEDEIAGQQVLAFDRRPTRGQDLLIGDARQPDPDLRVRPLHKP